jgi:hypothetical protein
VGLRLLALSASWLREGLSITCAWTACEETQLFEACFELQVLDKPEAKRDPIFPLAYAQLATTPEKLIV